MAQDLGHFQEAGGRAAGVTVARHPGASVSVQSSSVYPEPGSGTGIPRGRLLPQPPRTAPIREKRCAHAAVAGSSVRNSRTWRSQIARSAGFRTWAAPGSSSSWAPGMPAARRYELSGSTSRSPVGATTRVGSRDGAPHSLSARGRPSDRSDRPGSAVHQDERRAPRAHLPGPGRPTVPGGRADYSRHRRSTGVARDSRHHHHRRALRGRRDTEAASACRCRGRLTGRAPDRAACPCEAEGAVRVDVRPEHDQNFTGVTAPPERPPEPVVRPVGVLLFVSESDEDHLVRREVTVPIPG